MAHFGGADIYATIHTARDAVAADPDDVTAWNLLGYLHRLNGDEASAQDAWLTGIAQIAPCAGTTARDNLRVQSWLANVEACVGDTERAREKVARLTEAEPHNGYIKYRLIHVLAELGDPESAIRIFREAVQDGFLSAQLLQCDELLGLSSLTGLAAYRTVKQALLQNVVRAKEITLPGRDVGTGWTESHADPAPYDEGDWQMELAKSDRGWMSGVARDDVVTIGDPSSRQRPKRSGRSRMSRTS